MKNLILIFVAILFMASTCKEPTPPQAAECDAGYLPCDGDRSQCCEVTCDDGFHNCGETLTECCMDSTSHYFTWTIDTLGIYGSYLNDVAIVDENNIWVVGNIETDSGSYNAARWDGEEWELMLIVNPDPIKGIIYFSENDIWMVNGYPMHWDGNVWTLYPLHDYGMQVAVEHIWGTSSNDLYFVGLNGSIVHYDGENFVKMDSGTDVDLKDVAGTPDGEYVFVAGRNDSGESIALMIHDFHVETLYEGEGAISEPYGVILSVSVNNSIAYFATSSLLWKYNFSTVNSVIIPGDEIFLDNRTIKKIVVNNQNDIFIMTNWAEQIHYNGNTWNLDPYILDVFGPYNVYTRSLAYKDEMTVITGYCCDLGHAFVGRGYR